MLGKNNFFAFLRIFHPYKKIDRYHILSLTKISAARVYYEYVDVRITYFSTFQPSKFCFNEIQKTENSKNHRKSQHRL